jgi:hypothetical protein
MARMDGTETHTLRTQHFPYQDRLPWRELNEKLYLAITCTAPCCAFYSCLPLRHTPYTTDNSLSNIFLSQPMFFIVTTTLLATESI